MPITQEEFIEITNSIKNKDVFQILFGALLNIHKHLENNYGNMSEIENTKYNLFNIFTKQYNTTYAISKNSKYITKPTIIYDDTKSIHVLIRSCHELYLTYNFLSTAEDKNNENKEIEFKYKCYKLAGFIDEKRTFGIINHPSHLKEKEKLARNIDDLRKKITQDEIYKTFSKEIQTAILNGQWRVKRNKKLSWNELIEYTPIAEQRGKLEYHLLSTYAHNSYNSIILEAHNSKKKDEDEGRLAHLHTLSALMSKTTIETFKINPDILTKKEQALIIEFIFIARENATPVMETT